MNRILLAAAALLAAVAHAQDRSAANKAVSPPLIVVEDKGGASALPYYRALNPQDAQPGQPTMPQSAPPIGGPADAEAAMLPVRSARLSAGDEPRRVIRAPGLTPLFLVGDDDRSRAWLKQRRVGCRRSAPWAWWSMSQHPRHWPRYAASRRVWCCPRPRATTWRTAWASSTTGADHRHRHRALTR